MFWGDSRAAGLSPPVVAPAGVWPPVDGASAAVAALAGVPASRWACPVAPSEAVKVADDAPLQWARPPSAGGHALKVSSTEQAGEDYGPSFADVRRLNCASASACHVFTVPASDGQFAAPSP